MPSRTFPALFAIAVVSACAAVAVAQNNTGAISGRIQTANGMSAGAVRVAAMPAERNLATDGSGLVSIAETDSSGRYRLANISPGRYYIVAGPLEAPTFYPGTLNASGATTVNITPDAALEAVNFQLQRSGGVRLGGKLIRNAEWHDERSLTLLNMSTGETFGQTDISPDGLFEFVHVPPGAYRISAPNQFERIIWSSKPLLIGDRDVTDIGLTTGPFVFAAGRASVEGGGPLQDVWLSFKGPSGWSYVSIGFENRRDGTLRVALPVGEYRVELGGLSNAYQLASLRYGKTDLLREPLKVVGAVQPLFIALKTSRTAQFVRVSGRFVGIENLSEQYVVTPGVVLAVQNNYPPLLEVPIGGDGRFEFPRVLPGRYYIQGLGLPGSQLIVGSGGVSNFEFNIPTYRRVTGRVVVEGGAPPPRFDLTLTSNLPNGIAIDSYPNPSVDGTFAGMIPEGDHQIHVYVSNRYAVASITWGSTDLLREPLRVANRDVTEILVTLRTFPRPTFKVSGRLVNVGTLQGGGRTVTLSGSSVQLEAPLRSDGSFEFANVENGIYRASSASAVLESITVQDRDIEGIEIHAVPPQRDFIIELVANDEAPKPHFSLLFTRTQKINGVEPLKAYVSSNLLRNTQWLPEGEYRVEVRDFPDTDYEIKSITTGSTNLLKETLKIAEDGDRKPIIVTIAAKSGSHEVKVSGRVAGRENLKAPESTRISMTSTTTELDAPLDAAGRFEFPRVLPGIYSLGIDPYVATIPHTTVVVGPDNVANIQLEIPAERTVAGRVVIEDGYAMPPTRLRAWINAASGLPAPPHGRMYVQLGGPTIDTELDIGPAGSFKIVLPEGDHRIEIGGLSAKSYEVKSLTYGSTDLLKGPLKISGSDSRNIVVSLGVRQTQPWPKVSGRVLGISRLQGPVNVVLQGTRLAFQTTAASDGSFEFLRIPPDTYVVGTNPTVSAMIHPTVIAKGDEFLVELTIPERRQVKVRAVVEGNGRVPNFSLTVRLNGTEGYQISANPLSSGTFVYVSPTGFVCTGDVCSTARPGTLLNEPSVVRNADDTGAFGLLLPVGEHPITFNVFPPEFELLSATYGSTNLLKEPLRILDTDGEILLTFKPK